MSHACVNSPGFSTFPFFVLAAAISVLVNMASSKGANPTEHTQKLAQSGLHFALDLYKQCCKETSGNLFISPYSISVALAMTFAGAKKETANQMREIMKMEMIGEDALVHTAYKSSVDLLLESSIPGLTLDLANRMYVHKEMKVLPEFRDVLEKNYRTTSAEVDFANHEQVRLEINAWVEEQTLQKIKDLIAKGILDSLTRMVLVNAIYFKGDWASKFDPKDTKSGEFHLDSKNVISIDMMHANKKFPLGFNDDLECRILELPYVNQTLSMFVVLPNEIEGLTALEAKLTADALNDLTKYMSNRKVKVTVPKFRLETSLSLSNTLSAMGMSDLFNARQADLSGITGTNDLFVSALIHKAFLEVNEEGSEAAAATAAVISLRSMPMPEPDFVVDRPFILFIRDNKSGCVLFWGKVVNPSPAAAGRDEL